MICVFSLVDDSIPDKRILSSAFSFFDGQLDVLLASGSLFFGFNKLRK